MGNHGTPGRARTDSCFTRLTRRARSVANMAKTESKAKARFVSLGPDLESRVDALRRRRAVGGELPPLAAVIREAVRQGLPLLEAIGGAADHNPEIRL